jgi:hypothetical protein
MVRLHAHFETRNEPSSHPTPPPGTARSWLGHTSGKHQHARQTALIVGREAHSAAKWVGIAIATERIAYAFSRDVDTNAVTASSNCSSVTGLARTGAC